MRFYVISDTHDHHRDLPFDEDADGIIHCGDFSHGPLSEEDFLQWFSELPFKYKILVAGNHDESPEKDLEGFKQKCHLLGVTYLQDSGIEIEGVKFWGSPWTPTFGPFSFMDDDMELEKYWQLIPDDTNVLITHGPAYGVLDKARSPLNLGSKTLASRMHSLMNLKYHLFGHIHESWGEEQNTYRIINACSFNPYKRNLNRPRLILID